MQKGLFVSHTLVDLFIVVRLSTPTRNSLIMEHTNLVKPVFDQIQCRRVHSHVLKRSNIFGMATLSILEYAAIHTYVYYLGVCCRVPTVYSVTRSSY
jgi:hypothetical protein